MSTSNKIADLSARNADTRSTQLRAFSRAMRQRPTYAHTRTVLQVTPAGQLHVRILGETEDVRTYPVLNDTTQTQLWADLPDLCDPSAAEKSPRHLNDLLDQLQAAYLRGLRGNVPLGWYAWRLPPVEVTDAG